MGPKTERTLKDLKIETVADLASLNLEMLTRLFGSWGIRLHEFAHGIDNREVREEYETKSIGREVTFEKDITDEALVMDFWTS